MLGQRDRGRFQRVKIGHSINFELYHILEIDGALSQQKVCRKNKEVK